MADSYTKLLLHCNGVDQSTTFIDSSSSAHTITTLDNAKIITAQKKFGTGSGFLNSTSPFFAGGLGISPHSDFNFGTGDWTVDFWMRLESVASNNHIFSFKISAATYCEWNCNADALTLYRPGKGILDTGDLSLSANTWYHVAFVRSGNTFYVFLNGILKDSDTDTYNFPLPTDITIGRRATQSTSRFYGQIDEFRVSKGIARWTSGFTPPTEEYDSELPIDEEESIYLGEDLALEESREDAEEIKISEELSIKAATSTESDEIIEISEESEFQEDLQKDEEIIISEESVISQSLEKIEEDEIIEISEESQIGEVGDIDEIFSTDLRTLIAKAQRYATYLLTFLFSSQKYNTKLKTKVDTEEIFDTDLRVRYDDYDSIDIGGLDDFLVKLDGSELTDVDYSTLRITYTLNSTPSSATFVLARRHDNFDYQLDGTHSEISDENKIEIYDGSIKIFTGYITQVQGLSQTDTIQITAQDIRYQLSRVSVDLWYGGKWEQDEDDEDKYNEYKRTIGYALNTVLSTISSYISGYDTIPFATSHVPEYVETNSPASNLLDTLITQTANANWYIDENERLRFQQIGRGSIKSIPLSSLTVHRHAYDAIITDVTLNRQSSAYAKQLTVKMGSHIIRKWARREFSGWMSNIPEFYRNLKEKLNFCFQQWDERRSNRWYVGINETIYGYVSSDGWVLKPVVVIQYQTYDEDDDLDDIIVGSGSPTRTIHLNSYGKKEVTNRWEEKLKIGNKGGNDGGIGGPDEDDIPYLVSVREESYDHTAYATDIANFELSQNNQLLSIATITLLLDAYHYYGLNLASRVNLTNTIGANIYNNNNGFPLNVDRIEFDCSTRIVSLSLTNYGKSWYVKTANYMSKYTPPSILYKQPKEDIIEYSSGLST